MKALEDYSNKWKALVKIFSSNIVDPFYLQGIGSKTPMYASNHSTELGIYRCVFFFFFSYKYPGIKPGLPNCRQILYCLHNQESLIQTYL